MKHLGLLAAAIAAFSIGADAQIFGGSVASGRVFNAACSAGQLPSFDANHRLTGCTTASGTGTVTSVAMTVPSFLSVSGSPITTTGTLAVTLASQSAFTVLARESGSGTPSFQALAVGHIPSAFGTLATHQSGGPLYCRSTSGNDTYACSLTPALTAYTRGMLVYLDGDTANTGTATVNINSLGAISILDRAGSALADAAITANRGVLLYYNGTSFNIVGDGGSGGGGSLTVQGDGTPTGTAAATVNFISGTGVIATPAYDGANTRNNVTLSWNTTDLNAAYSRLNATNTAGSSHKDDKRAASTTDGFALPAAATAAPTANGYLAFGLNNQRIYAGYGGATRDLAWRLSGTNAARPTTLCLPGDTYYQSDSTAGLYVNSATGTCSWTIVGSSGLADPGGNGVVVRTALNTTTNRTITGTTDEISVTNGDGVSGNPTLSLPSTLNLSSKVVRIPNSTSLPGTCTVGDVYMDTDATSGQRIYACESTNTWVRQSDGNGGTVFYMRMGSQRVNASSTAYAGFAVDGYNATESVVQGRTLGGTATELRINPGGFQPGDGAMVCTLRQNGVDTALAVTLAAGSNSSTKGTGSVTITDGAQLSIGCANAASSGQSATVLSFLLRII